MARAFIADSDDESERDAFSPPPAAQAEGPHSFVSTASEPVSLATSSTDPVFFQGIYYEQQSAAARAQQLRGVGAGSVNLPMTAPTGTEQTDPVSLPSQYPDGTPLVIGDSNRGYASRAVKSAIMREKMTRQNTTRTADPYEFPSSAEEDRGGGARRAGRKTATGSSVAYRGTGGVAVDEEENMAPPSQKRQRLSRRRNDAVDSSMPPTALPIHSSIPPTMPPVNLDENIEAKPAHITSSLMPTVPMNDDPSLIINARGLTSSQKEQYVAVEQPASSDLQNQADQQDTSDQLPLQLSATSQRQKTQTKKSTSRKSKAAKQRRGKFQSGEDLTSFTQVNTPDETQERYPTVVLPNSEDDGHQENDTQPVNDPEPQAETRTMPDQAIRKKRGRPKKIVKQMKKAATTQLEAAESQKPATVPKKRGRPKKFETLGVKKQEVIEVEAYEAPTKPTDGHIAGVVTETEDTSDSKVEEAVSLNNVKVDDGKICKPAPGVTAAETPQKPAGKRTATPQMGSASKPLYRIGLSKRSRIAPLLKSLPK
ncbi:uncharacterized protein BBA_09389 [Beauveria bassiana ARSEF 2860]|uniref:AT hook domain-containing protein n=1 Tax=Beauveria bassiana (strain ARSEF 2860) TaxID=655819 RepID=J4KL68_BEAB2|nr:uncharacterized protein BBA_09389 [Beauveria bassiana ARSEF 2860]EJP61679.1 hypothetical protein BBA_09389 [Beauveria bassiana ARSEF 2860]